MKIIADAHIPFVKEYFSPYGELILLPGRQITSADVHDADMLLVRSVTKVNQALLQHSSVKFVGSITAGTDHLETNWLDSAGIAWGAAGGFNAPPVADYVVSVIAALQRQDYLGEKKLSAAVIGVGHVGKLVAARLKILGFKVILCDPIRAENEENFISTDLNDISDVDLITLHVPLTFDHHPTHHFMTKAFIERQKKNCVLINASRGAVIDTNVLLEYGQHLIWCFDVWENEPQIDTMMLENAIIATPHIAGYSVQSRIRGIDMIYQIACEKKIILGKKSHPITMPRQTLSKQYTHWQDIVLDIFDPALLTEKMKSTLLTANDRGPAFDAMRHAFNERYEFDYTDFSDANLIDGTGRLFWRH